MTSFGRKRPATVIYAVCLLWVWVLFLVISGLYQASVDSTQLEQFMGMLPPDMQITRDKLYMLTAAGYVLVALTMVGVVFRAGQGKRWARATLLLSFLIDLSMSAFSTYAGTLDYFLLISDMSLQIVPLWLLYTKPGKDWFV